MDRFVTRTPTWKTLNYSAIASQTVLQKKSLPKKTPADKKKPLQEKQLSGASTHTYDFDKRIGDLFPPNKANAENFNGNSNDSGLSSSSSISPQQIVNDCDNPNDKQKFSHRKNHLGKLSDYIDCPIEKENDSYVTITRTPIAQKKFGEADLRFQKTLENHQNNSEINKTPEKAVFKTSNMIMARIQRDFNSPSAAARMKAIRAMKSPTKSAYRQFDISETEKTFHLPEPPSLEEIMNNIVVYVEVRSGEDNRSAGVRKVIQALGARVCLSINRETTHVIFKDGLLSTFKKAKQMNIPIVSILWIEACKNQRRICDPKDFPISNLDRYENPELYTKMKRVKSMQPDSECNKRIRAKQGGTPKDSTPTQKTCNLKKTANAIGGTPTSSNNKKKTDISQFFKRIEKPTPAPVSKDDCDTSGTKATIDSPATQLLDRIQSENYTPLKNFNTKTVITQQNNKYNSDMEIINATNFQVGAQKALDFLQIEDSNRKFEASIRSNIVVEINATTKSSPMPMSQEGGRTRRRSLMADCAIETATSSMNTMAISVTTPSKSKSRRRSSIHTLKDMSIANETPHKMNTIEAIPEESNDSDKQSVALEKEQEKATKLNNRRRTLYAAKTMEQTELVNGDTETSEGVKSTNTRSSSRRRTLYNADTMECTELNNNKVISRTSNRRRTCFNLKSLEHSEISEASDRRTEHNNNKDETSEETINSPKVNKSSNRRRTLFAAKAFTDNNATKYSPDITLGNITTCLTPTNFHQKGGIASSTLLDDTECRSNLVATPPANATNGKLLEETEKCATPLIFSSTRQPGNKRRTLFDVSMDIITQRLQCINQSARKSLVPSTPSTEALDDAEKQLSTPINGKLSNPLLNNTNNEKNTKETLDECEDRNDVISITTPKTSTVQKKRKLFMPSEISNTPPTTAASCSIDTTQKTADVIDSFGTPVATNKTDSVTKRRRTLMPISQPQTTTVTLKETKIKTSITPTVRKRRSTLDFEQVQDLKTKTNNNVKIVPMVPGETSSQQQLKPKTTRVLVYTNMHQQQVEVIREVIDKLGLFVLESSVTDRTTHLVSLEPRRTLNLLRALVRGLWILDYSWIVESFKNGNWLPEEAYELQNFSRAIEICRSQREAFGLNYKCDLFCNVGAFYISSNCYPISKDNMRELIILCGGHVVNTRQKARYIIGDSNRNLEDKMYLTPFWILDSITQMQIMKVNKYVCPLSDGKPASQPIT